MENISFSIVIPTYNRAEFLVKTIASIMQQDFKQPYEILVIDDGSTDDTERLIQQFANSDKRIQYFKKKNAERGAARNYGAARASGKYLNFFDSDDLAYANHLSTAAKAIQQLKNPEIFHTSYDYRSGDKVVESVILRGRLNEIIQKQNKLSCNGVFLRKDIALSHPFSEVRALSASEDLVLWLQLSARYEIHGIGTVTSSVVQHGERSTVISDSKNIMTRMNLIADTLQNDHVYMQKYGRIYLPYIKSEKILAAALSEALSKKKKQSVELLIQAFNTKWQSLISRRFLAVVKYIVFRK